MAPSLSLRPWVVSVISSSFDRFDASLLLHAEPESSVSELRMISGLARDAFSTQIDRAEACAALESARESETERVERDHKAMVNALADNLWFHHGGDVGDSVREYIANDQKIKTVKAIKQAYGLSISGAKDVADVLFDKYGPNESRPSYNE